MRNAEHPNLRPHERFGAGNDMATTHGGRSSSLKLARRAHQLADELRPQVPLYRETDEPTLLLLGSKLARIELVSRWLAQNGWLDTRSRPRAANALLEQLEGGAVRLLGLLRFPQGLSQEPGSALAKYLAERDRGEDG